MGGVFFATRFLLLPKTFFAGQIAAGLSFVRGGDHGGSFSFDLSVSLADLIAKSDHDHEGRELMSPSGRCELLAEVNQHSLQMLGFSS